MSDRKFPILGTSVPPMIGREAIMERILRALTKPNPDHLQLVGPRFAGKTVILHELVRRVRGASTPYSAVLLWDLGHQTPNTDKLFMKRLASELSVALEANHSDYSKHLKDSEDDPYEDIAEVLEAVKADGGKVLAIMDGFDKPLSNGHLTRNLWDNLRELALKPSLRLVTGNRRTLRDLIRHPEAQTSDFWNLFDCKERIGCFDDNDLSLVLAQMPDLSLAAGAHTELWNASNGCPVMMLEVLNSLCEGGHTGKIDSAIMRRICEDTFLSVQDKIESLWTDCAPSCHDLLLRVLEEGPVTRTGSISADADTLVERGFVQLAGNKLQRPSQLLAMYLAEQPNESNSLVRLFGTAESYQQHFRGVLERRISQITGMDATLKRYLEHGVEDLPEHPSVFLSNVHGILEQVLALIWKAECWNSKTNTPYIPPDWFSIWRYNGERGFEGWLARFPEGGQRLRLLDLMTGTQKIDRLSRFVSKNTYVLANSVQGFRDFGVHPKAAEIDLSAAYAGLHLCIELAAAITRELPRV